MAISIASKIRSFGILYGKYKSRVFMLIILGLAEGMIGALGVSTLIPLFALISRQPVENAGRAFKLFQWMLDHLPVSLEINSILLFMVGLFFANGILLFIFKQVSIRIFSNFEQNLRSKLYRKFLETNWEYLLTHKLGYLENILMADVRHTATLLSSLISFIHSITTIIAYLAAAVFISPYATLLAVITGGIVVFLFHPLIRRAKDCARQQSALSKKISHEINENITGLKVIKASRVEEKLAAKGAEFFQESRDIKIRGGMLRSITTASLPPLSVLFIAGTFWYLSRDPAFSIGAFIAVIYLIQQIFVYVEKTQAALYDINQHIPSARHVLELEKEIDLYREEDETGAPFSFREALEFKGVNFAYKKNSVLSDLHFTVRKGEMVGIIGPSGAGKTTIVDLLLRLFEPREGMILLDGKNLTTVSLAEWRKNIGYVSQDFFLKNDTIFNNIRFYDERVDEKAAARAAQMAYADGFIEKLPRKFDTLAGERGIRLSVGQRQRIVLARIFARNPKILILDEATSALDNESESLIQEAIEKVRGETTIIMIAHRLSTVMNCDRIVVLENGRIVEEGSPRALLEDSNSHFHKAYNLK